MFVVWYIPQAFTLNLIITSRITHVRGIKSIGQGLAKIFRLTSAGPTGSEISPTGPGVGGMLRYGLSAPNVHGAPVGLIPDPVDPADICPLFTKFFSLLWSISPTFYQQLLRAKIPKAQKRLSS